jgi:hypothetical protein
MISGLCQIISRSQNIVRTEAAPLLTIAAEASAKVPFAADGSCSAIGAGVKLSLAL